MQVRTADGDKAGLLEAEPPGWLHPEAWQRRKLFAALTAPQLAISAVYLGAYVALDWISSVHSFNGFDLTPWQPPTGLSLPLLLLFGFGYIPLLFIAPVLSDFVVRGLPAPWPVELVLALIIGSGYSIAAVVLSRSRLAIDLGLKTTWDVFVLVATSVLTAAVVAGLLILALTTAGVLGSERFLEASLRYWIGDVIGIITVTPLLLIIATRPERPALTLETLFQAGAVIAVIVLTFRTSVSPQLDVFYLLFLPVVWIALRHGLEGACFGLLLAQIGLILASQMTGTSDLDLTAYQGMMLVLAVTGLAVGVTVTERRRAEQQLLLQQGAQARIQRLGSIGELAAALTHEINQPLSAATTYSRLAVEALEEPDPHYDVARDAAHKAATQLARTVRVVKELKEFIQLGRSSLAPVDVPAVIRETSELMKPVLAQTGTRIRANIAADLPPVLADRLHLQHVLVNILQNASDAMLGQDPASRLIVIEASTAAEPDTVHFRVRDSGPGFPDQVLARPFEPFATTKSNGLGIGLALSRTMIEAQGGRFQIANTRGGAVVSFTLKRARAEAS